MDDLGGKPTIFGNTHMQTCMFREFADTESNGATFQHDVLIETSGFGGRFSANESQGRIDCS